MQTVTAYPKPPIYYKQYTTENVKKWKNNELTQLDPPAAIDGPFEMLGQVSQVLLFDLD